MRRLTLVLLLILAGSGLFPAGAAPAADFAFKVTELGLPPEASSVESIAGMNNQGDVVGRVFMSDGVTLRAVHWDPAQEVGALLPLLPGYTSSRANGINDAAQIVGICYGGAKEEACLWQAGAVQALEPPAGLGPVVNTWAGGINNLGQVVGSASIDPGVITPGTYPVLWDHGPAQPLESPPLKQGQADFISNNGVVAGKDYNRNAPFLWTKAAGFINLEQYSKISGLNGSGLAVGNTAANQPCEWTSQGVATVLAPLQYGWVYGVNDLGQIVGFADSTKFLWQAGQVTDLQKSLLSYDWTLIEPSAINKRLQIAAMAWPIGSSSYEHRAVRLDVITKKPRFRLTDLGANYRAYGLNDLGEVVGEPAFLWQNGQMKSLGSGQAYAINTAGVIVGESSGTAVRWDRQGVMTPLEKVGTRFGQAYAVNVSGVAAGYSQNGSTVMPCIWRPDGTIEFLTDHGGSAGGIASNNLVVGYYHPIPDSLTRQAFACTVGGGFLDLMPGYDSEARAVNGPGQVVGFYVPIGSGSARAFLWEGGKAKVLTKIASIAYGINAAGQVVGTASGSTDFAFFWDPDLGMMNLNELLLPPQPDWNLTVANGINRRPQIIGKGRYQGQDHAFLLERIGTSVSEIMGLLLLN